MHPRVEAVTARIKRRSQATRDAYLEQIAAERRRPPIRDSMGCANLAHAWAAMPAADKLRLRLERAPHLAVISAYNDMLSAHQPYAAYPQRIRQWAAQRGASVQFASGVPAMCDGVTQGRRGMELSLLSRDLIAQATAIGLSHEVFDASLCLGVCDKIVPGLLIGSLHFGHLPTLFMPAGPMPSGLSNQEKSTIRERYAQGLLGREQLLDAESQAYHAPGTCTFYGTANSNQMLLEAMGLHVAGAAFAMPASIERLRFDEAAVSSLIDQLNAVRAGRVKALGIGELVDERVIVHAMIALLATGGSTNHLIHWVAVAKAAGILIDWDDFDALSEVTPLLARVYPNGEADVNAMQAAGGPLYILAQLLDAGLLFGEVFTATGERMADRLQAVSRQSANEAVLRPHSDPFDRQGGLRLLQGNLGRAVIKTSAVPETNWELCAPALVFETQEAFLRAFEAGELERDFVAVLRGQGPKANGMPELHKLTPPLSVLQRKGFRVALVTDGRMSGASGKVPAAIHLWPEARDSGPIQWLRNGDLIHLDPKQGSLRCLVPDGELKQRRDSPDAQVLRGKSELFDKWWVMVVQEKKVHGTGVHFRVVQV
ncbi:MAG: phosphogluconate dehydratase [Betaproteobacteria bacterium]|nr:phosphogluconate dehydratase [Betaproteobacteria bacterium]